MRRFRVQFVTEIDFVDGENVSDAIVRDYQKHLSDAVQDAAQHLPLRTIKGVRVETSRSQKSRMNSNARLRAYDARQHALERRPLRHRGVRQLRPLGRRQRRSAAGDPDCPRGRQAAPLQQLRRQDDLDPPRLAYEPTAGRS